MARELRPKEFYTELAKRTGYGKDEIEDIYLNLVDFILYELKLYGVMRLPYFCRLDTYMTKPRWKLVPDNHNVGKMIRCFIESRLRIKTTCSEGFMRQLEQESPTRLELKRQRVLAKEEKLKEKELLRQMELEKKLQENIERATRVKKENYLKRRGLYDKYKEGQQDENDGISY